MVMWHPAVIRTANTSGDVHLRAGRQIRVEAAMGQKQSNGIINQIVNFGPAADMQAAKLYKQKTPVFPPGFCISSEWPWT